MCALIETTPKDKPNLIADRLADSGIKVGDVIVDNDPRMPNRRLTIGEFVVSGGDIYARAKGRARGNASRMIEIRLDRIHTDGKPRRSGFSLLPA
jgi:hypothetical protein